MGIKWLVWRLSEVSGKEGYFMKRHIPYLSLLLLSTILTAVMVSPARAAASATNGIWSQLRQVNFGDRPISDGDGVIGLRAPYRAEDPAIVPITIKDLLPADSQRRIDKIWLIIDNNPVPLSAVFDFTPLAGRAYIATRVRVNAYTDMRAIAETDDGQLYMATRYVKASGGCSVPATKDPEAEKAHLGEIRLKAYDENAPRSRSKEVLLMIRHPNTTGLQMNPLTRLYVPAHFVKRISVDYAGAPMLTVNSTFSFSENPSLRFNVRQPEPGKLTVQVVDNQNERFGGSLQIAPMTTQVTTTNESRGGALRRL